jgi:septal ring factor EnvC (AmiA/AmiB activator)
MTIRRVLEAAIILVTVFLLGASYGFQRAMRKMQPAIEKNAGDLRTLENNIDQVKAIQAATDRSLAATERSVANTKQRLAEGCR